jgi:fatty acid desaturase
MSASRSSSGGGLGGLLGLLLLIGIIIKFIWWILGAVVLVVLFFIGRAFVRWYDRRLAAYERYRDGLAARADQQHNWVLQGDDRGIYGTEGAKLMHYLYPALDPNKQHMKWRSRG